ncbi:hypothetical protein HYC85_019063 [Camellia sinensis]|uniref:Protein CHUP1, chloroplastic n=1 Tax=Camellia sinensis TaxID=4442 RepID=A0A7J7GNE2_CAMSI|nr:hypothetical protein HYC85_019063 [Camellia sinensis]
MKKQEISPTPPLTTTRRRAESKSSGLSFSTTPSRLRAASSNSKAKDSPSPTKPQTPLNLNLNGNLNENGNNNGVLSPSPNPRAKSVPPPPRDAYLHNNNNQTARRRPLPLLVLSKPKSPSQSSQKEAVKAVGRSGNRPVVEQFARPRPLPRRQRLTTSTTTTTTTTYPNSNSNSNNKVNESDDLDWKKRAEELLEKLDRNETLITNLQSEVLELKTELDKAQSFNAELQSHNSKLSEDLAAAHSKIATLSTTTTAPPPPPPPPPPPDQVKFPTVDLKGKPDSTFTQTPPPPTPKKKNEESQILHPPNVLIFWMKRESGAEYQSHRFKDIQKLIATKLEHSKLKNEAINNASPTRVLTAPSTKPIPIAMDVQSNVPACHLPLPPHPPPPPPPRPRAPGKSAITRKDPPVVESRHVLTKCDRSSNPSGSGNCDKPLIISAHSSIVGEIQKRSSHLLALIEEVVDAAYTDIEDVLKFVDWLDNQLSSLADEQAVLKHFNWPEKKADAMREAAVEYRGLKLLESEVSSYKDDASVPCGVSLKKMAGLLDKSEHNIQKLIKLRNSVMLSYQHLKIPTNWMLDSGVISKIKQSSMMLAKIYMRRVLVELESIQYSERESTQEGLLIQGVHFAYRAHQFAGGLDSETLCAFEEIRQRVPGHLRGSQELLVGIPSS